MATLKTVMGKIIREYPISPNSFAVIYGVLPNSVIFAISGASTSRANLLNSSFDPSASGKITSAPASIYIIALSKASSIPVTPLASVLAITRKSLLLLAPQAASIFSAISSAVITSLPARWPHLLGNLWSSI